MFTFRGAEITKSADITRSADLTGPGFLRSRNALSGAGRTLLVTALLALGATSCTLSSETASGDTEPPVESAPTAEVTLGAGDEVIATLDDRFQSYNVEMVEVTGGEFWSPYSAGNAKVTRPPIDLASERLRNLAKALGPVYIRVSGTWANSTFFDVDNTTNGTPPEGFGGVLTPDQWLGVKDFAEALDSEITTSFASYGGVRDSSGNWITDQAEALLRFSVDNDVPLAAVEMFNEPSLPVAMPDGYTPKQFADDFKVLQSLTKQVKDDLILVGPGTAAEDTPLVISATFKSDEIFKHLGPQFDVFSFHAYPKVSERCASKEGPEIAFDKEFLARVATDSLYYRGVRDEFLPGAPIWITETAQAACGGDRWAATYRDMIRYVDTLGRLAADGSDGDVVFHNTLAASDYGLLDEDGFKTRPNYWAAVMWKRLMGPKVLKAKATTATKVADLYTYAHCSAPNGPTASGGKGVTYAVVNASTSESRTVSTPSGKGVAYVMSSENLDGTEVELNGQLLQASDDGTVPQTNGRKFTGSIEVPPTSVAFVVDTESKACA